MRWNGQVTPRGAAGLIALAVVPAVVAAIPLVPLFAFFGPGPAVGVLAAVLVGIGGSALLGPILVERRIERLPRANLDEEPAAFLDDRIGALAGEVGVDAPDVLVVNADAANVAVTDGYRGATLVVSTRLLSLPEADRDAALRHALVRLDGGDAAVTTALLPATLLVETLGLLATLLVARREERGENDRRVNRIHGYEPERNRIPWPVYTLAGALLWVCLLPIWVPFVIGDRLYVAGSRRAADAAVARASPDDGEGLANAVEYARDAAGAGDWPPLIDRLSLLSMADEETRRVRGTSRQETRIRLARLRSKRRL
ncbi:hypothetical protein JCM17823_01500 [Halorubrum gandharaense]